MSISIENVEESDQPFTSIHVPNEFAKGKIYWDGTTFPDATLVKEQESTLKVALSEFVDKVYIDS